MYMYNYIYCYLNKEYINIYYLVRDYYVSVF